MLVDVTLNNNQIAAGTKVCSSSIAHVATSTVRDSTHNDTRAVIDYRVCFGLEAPGIAIVPAGEDVREVLGQLVWPASVDALHDFGVEEFVTYGGEVEAWVVSEWSSISGISVVDYHRRDTHQGLCWDQLLYF